MHSLRTLRDAARAGWVRTTLTAAASNVLHPISPIAAGIGLDDIDLQANIADVA